MKTMNIIRTKISPLGIAAGVLLMFSCQKSFLEINPKGKLIAEKVEDYDMLLNNNSLMNTGGANAQVFLGDEVAAAEPNFSTAEPRTQRLFRWEGDVYEPDQNAPETQSLLRQVYLYNKIINEVGSAEGGTEARKNALKAEARAGRAWVYLLLINYFGKPYHPSTASTDLGFPIIRAANVTETSFERASVQEVYDFIEEDLVEAITHLPAQTRHRLRMSRPAAEALLGKVYLFTGRFDEALPLLNDALNGIAGAAVPIELIDYNEAFAPGGQFLPLSPFGPSTPLVASDPETLYARQFSNFWITTSELVISPATVALFGADDQRLNFYSNMPFPAGDVYQNGLLRRTGPLTYSYGVVLADLILMRAECRIRLGDLGGGISDLENLRVHRMPAESAAVPSVFRNDQRALLDFVIDERIREFASMGMRWFDMRRLSVDPLFAGQQYSHSIHAEDGSVQELQLPSERLVLRIPPKILLENPGMEDND